MCCARGPIAVDYLDDCCWRLPFASKHRKNFSARLELTESRLKATAVANERTIYDVKNLMVDINKPLDLQSSIPNPLINIANYFTASTQTTHSSPPNKHRITEERRAQDRMEIIYLLFPGGQAFADCIPTERRSLFLDIISRMFLENTERIRQSVRKAKTTTRNLLPVPKSRYKALPLSVKPLTDK